VYAVAVGCILYLCICCDRRILRTCFRISDLRPQEPDSWPAAGCWARSGGFSRQIRPRRKILGKDNIHFHVYGGYGSTLLTPVFRSRTAQNQKQRVPPASSSAPASNEILMSKIRHSRILDPRWHSGEGWGKFMENHDFPKMVE
jgi:hypothetical protein